MEPENILLFDSSRGIYIPQAFCKSCNPDNSYWVWDYETFGDILLNPENPEYWVAWETVLDSAYYYNPETCEKYHLNQDENGDLWAVPFS